MSTAGEWAGGCHVNSSKAELHNETGYDKAQTTQQDFQGIFTFRDIVVYPFLGNPVK